MTSQFQLNLREASRWCAEKANIKEAAKSLRSPELAPEWREGWREAVKSVCDRRARFVCDHLTYAEAIPAGRLLIFDPGQSLSDGAAMAESAGFFDADNTPPWDTWLIYVIEAAQRSDSWTILDSYLVCWIPNAFEGLVERAIAVNPEKCLLWVDEVDTPFFRHLRRAGRLDHRLGVSKI
jgi:hypothetical protein